MSGRVRGFTSTTGAEDWVVAGAEVGLAVWVDGGGEGGKAMDRRSRMRRTCNNIKLLIIQIFLV